MTRKINAVFAAAMLTVIFGLCVLSAMNSGDGYFFWENRTQNVIPSPSAASVLDGSFADGVEDGLSDRVWARESMLALKAKADLYLFRRLSVSGQLVSDPDENGDSVLLDYHGFYSWDTSYMADMASNVAAAAGDFADAVTAYGGLFYYVSVPQQFSYYAALYPDWADCREWNVCAMRDSFAESVAGCENIAYIDGREYLSRAAEGSSVCYAPDDHHFTLLGAAMINNAITEAVERDTGYAMLTGVDFTFAPLPNQTLGSRSRKLYGAWLSNAPAYIAVPNEPVNFTRTDNGEAVAASVFDVPDEDEYALYSVYMGGDIAETVIDTNRPGLPDALIFGDSFTNALETLLYASFNVTRCVDLRYYDEMTIAEYVELYKPDIVICLRDETVLLSQDGNGNFAGK